MLELKFNIEGTPELSRKLRGIEATAKNLEPAFEKSVKFIKEFTQGEVFNSRGGALGEPWAPRKKDYPWPILEKTGKMRRSFQAKSDKMSGEVWNAVDYFKYHQSNQPRKKLPRRIMLKLVDQTKNRIVKFFQELFIKELQKR